MSSTTPLMLEYSLDVKEPVDSGLPVYSLNEDAEELAVGGVRRKRLWDRFCYLHQSSGEDASRKKKSSLRKWILALLLVVGVSAWLFFKDKHSNKHHRHPTVLCSPIESVGSRYVEAPIGEHAQINLHKSLNRGDIRITHSDEIEKGRIRIEYTIPEGTQVWDGDEDVPQYYQCLVHGKKHFGFGVHSKDKHAPRVKSTSTVITLPTSEQGHARAIDIMGPRHHHKFGRHGFLGKFMHKFFHKKFDMHRRIRKAVRKAAHDAAGVTRWRHNRKAHTE